MSKVTLNGVAKSMRRTGFRVTEKQINEYFKSRNIKISDLPEFATGEREMFSDYISRRITGMNSPSYGESILYKILYYERLAKRIDRSEYSMTNSKKYKLSELLLNESKLKLKYLKNKIKRTLNKKGYTERIKN